jgi:hypothetical protein
MKEEKNLTIEELKKLYALMPKPGECPHGAASTMTATFGPVNSCGVCMEEAKKKLVSSD